MGRIFVVRFTEVKFVAHFTHEQANYISVTRQLVRVSFTQTIAIGLLPILGPGRWAFSSQAPVSAGRMPLTDRSAGRLRADARGRAWLPSRAGGRSKMRGALVTRAHSWTRAADRGTSTFASRVGLTPSPTCFARARWIPENGDAAIRQSTGSRELSALLG